MTRPSVSQTLESTAYWTASVRAQETARPDRLFDDPWAEALAGDIGTEWISQRPSGSTLPIVLRTRYFDDFLQRITKKEGIRQVVLLEQTFIKDAKKTINDIVREGIAKLGENITSAVELLIAEKGGKLGGRAVEIVKLDDESKPDKAQENFFFGLLKECVENGTISEALIKEHMKENHVRHDAFEVMEKVPDLPKAA